LKAGTKMLIKTEGKEAFSKARTKTWKKKKKAKGKGKKDDILKAGTETLFTAGGNRLF